LDKLIDILMPSQSTKSGVTTTITDVTSHVTKNLERLKLNHLIAIGGDDTGTIALDAAREGKSGLMTAIVNGSFALVEIPDPKLGPRKMDVETMYNKERLRPNYSNKVGVPIFLTRA